MMNREKRVIHVLVALLGLQANSSALAQTGRRTTVAVEGTTVRHNVEYDYRQFLGTIDSVSREMSGDVPGILWTFDDTIHPAPIPESVALSTFAGSAWVGQTVNDHRLQRFLIEGTGTPVQQILGITPSQAFAAAASEADLSVWLVETSSVVLEAYNSSSNIVLWDFSVPAPYTNINKDSISVSRDGSVVCLAVRDDGPPEASRVFLLDGLTGTELQHIDYPDRIVSVDLVDDGSSCLVMIQGSARIIDVATGTDAFVGSTIGSTSPARISGEGNVVVVGGFTEMRVFTKTEAGYSEAINLAAGNLAFQEVGVSRDGSTVVAAAGDFSDGFRSTSTFVFDVASESLIGRFDTTGTGVFQDIPSAAVISDDGSVIAVAFWGTQNNDHPEVMVFDRCVNQIGSIDTDGSVLALDISGNGVYLIAGSKSVHANVAGSGGSTTMYQVFEPGVPRIIFVDDDALDGGDGASWAMAFDDLQDALDSACAGVEIYVAEGTYSPSRRTEKADPRTATFQLFDGVAMYGGFAGNEESRGERNPLRHETILSGDLNNDDGVAGINLTDNAYHVVTANGATPAAVIDGFTVTRGVADGDTSAMIRGGGMLNVEGSPTISSCYFVGNYAYWGGGMFNDFGVPEIVDCEFGFNHADLGGGGGMYNSRSSAVFRRCLFHENTSLGVGGAVHNFGPFTVEMHDCVFDRNRALSGGAIANNAGPDFTLVNGLFTGNEAIGGFGHQAFGGAVMNFGGSTILVNCAFTGNSATGGLSLSVGGAILNLNNTADFFNCSFYGNDAAQSGGGMYNVSASDVTLHSCLLWENTDTAGTHSDESAQVFLSDLKEPNVFSVNYSTIQNWTGVFGGAMNDGVHPLFADPDGVDDVLGTIDDDLRLQPDSLSINTGSPTPPPMSDAGDLDGGPRVLCSVVDRGAYEFGLGDDDCDRDVDLFDIATMLNCFEGNNSAEVLSCEAFDSSNDGMIDLADWTAVRRKLNGPRVSP